MLLASDHGPIYKETLQGLGFPVEPWNTTSNLIFLFIIIYFVRAIRRSATRHGFTEFAIPVLTMGFVGGSLYHAFRAHRFWLLMDFIPILFLALSAAAHFWSKFLGSRAQGAALSLVLFGISFVCVRAAVLSGAQPAVVGYGLLAVSITAPILAYLSRAEWRGAGNVFGAIALFVAVLYFRAVDLEFPLPMGSHFLWHVLGGGAVFFLMKFVFEDELNCASDSARDKLRQADKNR